MQVNVINLLVLQKLKRYRIFFIWFIKKSVFIWSISHLIYY